MNLNFIFNSGKNTKWIYYLTHISLCSVPSFFFQYRLKFIINELNKRNDIDYILERVNYYNKLTESIDLPSEAKMLKQNRIPKNCGSVYYYDSQIIAKYFDSELKWITCFGDVNFLVKMPSIVKSRPIVGGNKNSVILKLEKVRHFIFLKDKKEFIQKMDKVIFRGKIEGKPQRINFVNKYFNNSRFDIGDVSRNSVDKLWKKDKMTLWKHLDFKFIMSLEGNDVASNLKWIMSSNSIAVMPKPTCETWFMEGKLIPNVHYIEVKEDFSDLEEKIQFYIDNPEKALSIIKNANYYTTQFLDKKREKIISILVLKKYFEKTNQKINS